MDQSNPFALPPDCARCASLARRRRYPPLHGCGRADARVLVVDGSPGHAAFDRQGHALPDTPDGRRLRFLMEEAALAPPRATAGSRHTVPAYLTNTVRCLAARTRPPRAAEVATCGAHLAEELVRLDPALVVVVGAPAARAVTDLLGARGAHRRAPVGRVVSCAGLRLFYLPSPGALGTAALRQASAALAHVTAALARRADEVGELTAEDVRRVLLRVRLAHLAAAARADDERAEPDAEDRETVSDAAYWVRRMTAFAALVLGTTGEVGLRIPSAVGFRWLGDEPDGPWLQPVALDVPGGDLRTALAVAPTPRAAFVYWVLQRHLWRTGEALRYEVVHDPRTLAAHRRRKNLVPGGEAVTALAPPGVRAEGDAYLVSVVVRDVRAPALRLLAEQYDVDPRTGAVHCRARRELSPP